MNAHDVTLCKCALISILPLLFSCNSVQSSQGADINLCEGLVTDNKRHPMRPLEKPAPGKSVIDPAFGTRIHRITKAPPGSVIKPLYSPTQAWNANESLLILYHTDYDQPGHSLYDGKTYRYLRELDISPPDLEQVYWHHSDPDILYYIDAYDNRLIRYRVSSGKKESIHDFSCDYSVAADSHAFISWDSNTLGLLCRNDSGREIFQFHIGSLKESNRRSTQSYVAPAASPSGSLFYFEGSVLDKNMKKNLQLDLGNPFEHSSLGRLANGRDTYNEVSFDGAHIGSLVTHDMHDGSVRVIIGPKTGYPYPPSGTHISAVAFKRPGWIAVSSVGRLSGNNTLDQELYLANTNPDSKTVCRVAHHRSWGKEGPKGYWAEPHVVISPTGTRLLFGSDWGGGDSVDSYVVELPNYTKEVAEK
jgi:hypothetical protein